MRHRWRTPSSISEPFVAPYRFENMKAIPLFRQTVPWNWKISLENFSEAYHQPWVHPQTADQSFPASKAEYLPSAGGYSVFRLNPAVPGEVLAIVPAPPFLGMSSGARSWSTMFTRISIHWPIQAQTVMMDLDITSAGEHEQIWTMLINEDEAEDLEGKRDDFLKFIGPILAEDIGICKAVGQGAQARHAVPGRLSKMERAIHEFHNWWLDRMQA